MQEYIDELTVLERAQAPTPVFFRKLRAIGVVFAAASAAILTMPVAMPAIITTIAGYLAVAGSVAAAVSQVTVEI
ncbi:hypothetical protein [Filimonas effusa]|uniref:Uncharacterized protein n=1 Tax=Filimonas effusa TaxID=2508721 RepID=A0A4Q1DCU7_9BACT|nr:hypothetical protein [Filimonas effusa]RXK87331.1 hypothetical protein ESB13_11295 [Filimonas effusa]